MFALDARESANTGSNKDAGSFCIFGSDHDSRLLHRKIRRSHGVIDEVVHFLEVFLIEPYQWLEIFDLRCDPGRELRGVEAGDIADSATSFAESFPRLFSSCTQRGHQTHAGYNNSSFFQMNLAYDFGRCASM